MKNVAFTLRRGSMMILTGPSGSGKTTLLRTIAGLSDPDEGDILFDGLNRNEYPMPEYRRRVALVAQTPTLRNSSVLHNLKRPFLYKIASSTEFPALRAKSLLAEFNLPVQILERQARSLSIGQQQRISLVRALLVDPNVLLLDEPTSALDRDATLKVLGALRHLADETGLASIIATHELHSVIDLCDGRYDLIEGNLECA